VTYPVTRPHTSLWFDLPAWRIHFWHGSTFDSFTDAWHIHVMMHDIFTSHMICNLIQSQVIIVYDTTQHDSFASAPWPVPLHVIWRISLRHDSLTCDMTRCPVWHDWFDSWTMSEESCNECGMSVTCVSMRVKCQRSQSMNVTRDTHTHINECNKRHTHTHQWVWQECRSSSGNARI